MQTTTVLALLCAFAAVFISVNDSAPANPKPVTMIMEAPVVVTAKPLANYGGRSKWSTKIDAKSKKIFNDHKKAIAQKLQATHKVSPKFVPKPDKAAAQVTAGITYHYLVKLPSKQYAYVTVTHQQWKKEIYGKGDLVNVRPQLYALNDKNI